MLDKSEFVGNRILTALNLSRCHKKSMPAKILLAAETLIFFTPTPTFWTENGGDI